eukprot:scaffold7340_cov266-Pinguiococcus_pyrenoidosus.AAC.76
MLASATPQDAAEEKRVRTLQTPASASLREVPENERLVRARRRLEVLVNCAGIVDEQIRGAVHIWLAAWSNDVLGVAQERVPAPVMRDALPPQCFQRRGAGIDVAVVESGEKIFQVHPRKARRTQS